MCMCVCRDVGVPHVCLVSRKAKEGEEPQLVCYRARDEERMESEDLKDSLLLPWPAWLMGSQGMPMGGSG